MRAILLAWTAFVLGGVSGCGPSGPASDPSLDLDVAVSPTPALEGSGQVRVRLSDTTGAPVEEARVVITGLMTHAGMTPVVDTARQEEPGLWVAPDFDFDMTGDWVLEVRATLPDGRRAAAEHSIRVVGRP